MFFSISLLFLLFPIFLADPAPPSPGSRPDTIFFQPSSPRPGSRSPRPTSPTSSSPRPTSPNPSGPFTDFSTCPEVLSCTNDQVPHACCRHRFGVLKLAQQWNPGFGPEDAFTMHGLWPNSCDRGRPLSNEYQNGCDNKRVTNDVAKLLDPSMKSEMEIYWPSSFGGKPGNSKFWTHEWNKHGTCYSPFFEECGYSQEKAVLAYFRQALELRRQFDFYRALKDSGILFDGTKVALVNIKNALKRKLNLDVEVYCKGDFLTEIRATFKVIGRNKYVPHTLETDSSRGCGSFVAIPPKRSR